MRWLLTLSAALAVCCGVVRGGDGFFDMEEDPARLVDAALEGEGLAIFLVVEPGCEACDITRDGFNEYGRHGLQGRKSEFAQRAIVDRSIDPVSSAKLGVVVAPTVVMVRGGEVIARAPGDLESYYLERWLDEMLGEEVERFGLDPDVIEDERAREIIEEMEDPGLPQNRFKRHMERHELPKAADLLFEKLELNVVGPGWIEPSLMCVQERNLARLARWHPPARERFERAMGSAREVLLDPSGDLTEFSVALRVYTAFAFALGEDASVRETLGACDPDVREAVEDELLELHVVDPVIAGYEGIDGFLASRMRLRIAELAMYPDFSAAQKAMVVGTVADDGALLFGAFMEHGREAEAMLVADWVLGRFTDPLVRLDLLRNIPYDAEPREWMREWLALVEQALPPARADGEEEVFSSARARYTRTENLINRMFQRAELLRDDD